MIVNEQGEWESKSRRKKLQDMMKKLSMMMVSKFNTIKETIIVSFLDECLVLLL